MVDSMAEEGTLGGVLVTVGVDVAADIVLDGGEEVVDGRLL